ncbi:MAG: asparagine synthase (glutamine-hydrolyzing) [Ignavibacteriaceae bacterium]|nr:asparagine synthase (glutamine-hydrolyzing) [Ignavibacteriaceae bacterium]
MCGICGYISKGHAGQDIIRNMNNAIAHRGPDSEGFFREENVALAMRRLAIIDLETGNQPIYNSDMSRLIMFNGEISNFHEIRKDLEESGFKFKTRSDTEVILLGYDKFGEDIFSKLNGMFSIAIYDRKKRTLIIARDRLGIKPLYYTSSDSDFIFASEIKSILQHPGYSKQINFESVNNLLKYKYIPNEKTLYSGIVKMVPGSYLKINSNPAIIENTRYWKLSDQLKQEEIESFEESKELVYKKLYDSVKHQLFSDVPLGVYLSGGIDSAILTNLASDISENRISTFSIGFKSKSYNELKWAEITSKFNNTLHHELIIDPKDLMNTIDHLVYSLDEPIGDYAILPTYYLSQFARKNVKVALSGAGGDELFGGYERYWMNKGEKILNLMPTSMKHILARSIDALPESKNKKSYGRRLKKYLGSVESSLSVRYDKSFELITKAARNALFTSEVMNHHGIRDEFNLFSLFPDSDDFDFVKSASFVDLLSILPNDYLLKEDKMSMANSLEVRVPFLDHELVELSFKIKSSYKIKGLKTKYILRDLFKDKIHPEILNRGKSGFEVPVREWLKNELSNEVESLFMSSLLVNDKIFNAQKLKELLNGHLQGLNDNSKIIFTIIGLEYWYRQNFS